MPATMKTKYFLPVEVSERTYSKLLNIKTYEYKVYADNSGVNFTYLRFLDLNGIIIGEHMPTDLQTLYDKAAHQVKTTSVKVAEEVKNLAGNMKGLASEAGGVVKSDFSKTAAGTVKLATSVFGKVKKKLSSKKNQEEEQEKTKQ